MGRNASSVGVFFADFEEKHKIVLQGGDTHDSMETYSFLLAWRVEMHNRSKEHGEHILQQFIILFLIVVATAAAFQGFLYLAAAEDPY